MEKNPSEAAGYYQIAAYGGDPQGQYRIGYCYDRGIGVPRDERRMIYWYKKAAEQRFPKAIDRLGVCYETGRGVERDREQAYELSRIAARETERGGLYTRGLV